jgi:NAD(P)-dependent dehydrogenase (short-subunit alcohol dehydrogenase family)
MLAGQVAVVTGAGRGVGRAIAERLAAAGAAVALLARSADQLEEVAGSIRAAGGRSLAVPVDVTREGRVRRAFARVERELGAPSLLVNNAATLSAIGPTWEVDPDAWWRDVEVTLRGSLLCSRAVLPGMVARGEGRIVNVTSLYGARPSPYVTSYACAKAALFRLTEGLAAEAGPHGVKVFAISPGWVRTEMTEALTGSEAGRRWLPEVAALPEESWVGPERAAELVAFLASGRGDALSGRYLYALDDPEELVRRAAEIERDDLYVLRLRR